MHNPYEYKLFDDEDGELSYTFESVNGALYSVTFDVREYNDYTERYPHLFNFGHALSFFRMTRPIQKSKLDERIEHTIGKIISDFFTDNGNEAVLLFHCDFSDKRQKCRDHLFTQWYSNSPEKNNYFRERVGATVFETNVTHYMGFLTPMNNPNLALVQLEFDACYFNLIQDKVGK